MGTWSNGTPTYRSVCVLALWVPGAGTKSLPTYRSVCVLALWVPAAGTKSSPAYRSVFMLDFGYLEQWDQEFTCIQASLCASITAKQTFDCWR